MEMMKRLLREEDGQAVTEYVIILFMISIVTIALVTTVGQKVNNMYSFVNNTIPQ